jgi:BirA family transcriptional regulator, biotin operon repressor / biotin---[acetyl-CoA-carboxylase] ligase
MNTLFAGQTSIHLSTVDSTNSYASGLLQIRKPAEGTLIYTFQQENGRGQRGNTWESVPNKNVALSLILYPGFLPAERQFMLSKMSALAVADLMAELLGDEFSVRVKWPNDIYVSGRKIAGILIETGLRQHLIQNAVIGIGINVNQAGFTTTTIATSLMLLTKKEHALMPCVERLCELLEARYLQLKGGKEKLIDADYLRLLYRRDEKALFTSGATHFEGTIRGVDSGGKLIIETNSGEERAFAMKEVSFADLT